MARPLVALFSCWIGWAASQAAVITVTTPNNTNPPAGQTSLLQALSTVANGDVIRFSLPDPGPHYLVTPPGGYPYLTAHNVTIDGYSQPDSAPNTNAILRPNNARIQIVLDSRLGGHKLMDFPGDTFNDDTGYGNVEGAVLGVLGATNLTVRGLGFLGVPFVGEAQDVSLYFIALAKGASAHIQGCWMGVDPDGTSLFGAAEAITGFRYRSLDENNVVTNTLLVNGVTIGVAPSAVNPRAQFNVIAGIPVTPIHLEGNGTRIAGNFLQVLPDGAHDYNPALDPAIPSGTAAATIRIGRSGNNTLTGTDGDGINDADERNIMGGVLPPALGGAAHTLEFYAPDPGTNVVIAGNFIGVGIDGVTRFTNGVPPLNAAGSSATYRFGSDLDGVSDALEANLVMNNYPPELFGPASPNFSRNFQPDFLDELEDTGTVSLRGNTLVNNFTPPVNPLKNNGAHLTNYYSRVLASVTNGLWPVLFTNTSIARLVGSVPPPATSYPRVTLDLYVPDPEGLTNGIAANLPGLTNGFIQGKTYLGSYAVDGPADFDPTPGAFEFDISSLNLTAGTLLTVSANYSKDSAGAHNATAITTLFSPPMTAKFAVAPPRFNKVVASGSSLILTWSGGTPPYQVQARTNLTVGNWSDVGPPTISTTATVTIAGDHSFYRVQGR